MIKVSKLDYKELDRFLRYDPVSGDVYRKINKYKGKAGAVVGYERKDGYKMVKWNSKTTLLSRICYTLHHGSEPKNIIDHIDGNPSNNKISNLRDVTQKQNTWNSKNRKNTKYPRGVYRNGKRYSSQIIKGGQKFYLGIFDTPKQAHDAYLEAGKKHHGEYRRIRQSQKSAPTHFGRN